MSPFARQRPRLTDLACTLLISMALTGALFWPSRQSLTSPIIGGDSLASYATGFVGRTSTALGYPFGMNPFPYFPNTDVTQRALASVLQALTGERFLSVTLVWLLSFPLTALAAWWVFRLSGATRLLAIPLAVSFSFVPYHVLRGLDHIYLAAMWSVPLALGLALLVGRGEVPRLFAGGRSPRSATVASCLVVAWSGIYYAFFACVLMVTALAWLLAHGASRRTLARSAVPLAIIALSVLAVLTAAAIANAADPPTSLVADRQPSESALYSGSLAFALTPSPLTDVPVVGSRTSRFDAYVQPELEGYGYGQFGTVVSSLCAAVLVVGVVVISRRRRKRTSTHRIDAQSGHALHLLLLSTSIAFFVPWSVNFSFSLLVTPEIRAWDRLLPIILLLLMTSAVAVAREVGRPRAVQWQAAVGFVIIALTVLDGITPYSGVVSRQLQAGEQRVRQGAEYAATVNEVVPEDCGVLQLPYVPFPEKAIDRAGMEDYEHFLVALTNPRKRWSYGGVKYTTQSRWAAHLGDQLDDASVDALVEGGFCGVHVDRRGYTRSGAAETTSSLERLLGPPAADGYAGRWLFFELPRGARSRDPRARMNLTPATERFFYPPSDPP